MPTADLEIDDEADFSVTRAGEEEESPDNPREPLPGGLDRFFLWAVLVATVSLVVGLLALTYFLTL